MKLVLCTILLLATIPAFAKKPQDGSLIFSAGTPMAFLASPYGGGEFVMDGGTLWPSLPTITYQTGPIQYQQKPFDYRQGAAFTSGGAFQVVGTPNCQLCAFTGSWVSYTFSFDGLTSTGLYLYSMRGELVGTFTDQFGHQSQANAYYRQSLEPEAQMYTLAGVYGVRAGSLVVMTN